MSIAVLLEAPPKADGTAALIAYNYTVDSEIGSSTPFYSNSPANLTFTFSERFSRPDDPDPNLHRFFITAGVAESIGNIPPGTEFAEWVGFLKNMSQETSGQTYAGHDEIDIVFGSDFADMISLGKANDYIEGGDGADLIDGGFGADWMVGGLGSDLYVVDNPNDIVDSSAYVHGDYDRVFSSTISIDLSDHDHFIGYVFGVTLGGASDLDITGNGLPNYLVGNAGRNVIEGRGGADRMVGLAGDDTYIVNSPDDLVDESLPGSNGTDTVVSASISIDLSDTQRFRGWIENVVLTGSDNLNATGNNFQNVLTGNSGKNLLDGGAHSDVMIGMGGSDTYVIDNIIDVADESVAGSSGIDYLFSRSVSLNLLNTERYKGVIENIGLGGNLALNAYGSHAANVIVGNAARNGLDGKNGNDLLTGGLGNDAFVFSTALGPGNVDHITDFTNAPGNDDSIGLWSRTFVGLASLDMDDAFRAGTEAQDASDRVIYDQATGSLSWDFDGFGGQDAVLFAILDTKPLLTSADFFVFT